MNLWKAYDEVDTGVLWDILLIYGIGDCMLIGLIAFYKEVHACLRVVSMYSCEKKY